MRTMILELSVPRIALTRLLGRVSRAAYTGPASPLRIVDLPDPPLPASAGSPGRALSCTRVSGSFQQAWPDGQ